MFSTLRRRGDQCRFVAPHPINFHRARRRVLRRICGVTVGNTTSDVAEHLAVVSCVAMYVKLGTMIMLPVV